MGFLLCERGVAPPADADVATPYQTTDRTVACQSGPALFPSALAFAGRFC
jgi:hypothetical protein